MSPSMKKPVHTETTVIRYSPELRDRIDAWRGKQPGVPSRADAVRKLLEKALAVEDARA
jgi:hypothetical protein